MLRVGIVAGETSGDQLGAALIRALQEISPEPLVFEGIAGPRMVEAGCRALVDTERLSVMGLVEVLAHLPALLGIRRRIRRHFIDHPPDVFIGVDAPDFNIPLEGDLRAAGIPTVHYVSPTVWAWRPGRIARIGRAVDRVLSIFPFEEDLYHQRGVDAVYVGHPLGDEIPLATDQAACRRELGVAGDAPLVAVLPGSRRGELKYLARPFVATVRWLNERRPEIRFVAPMATPRVREMFERALAEAGGDLPVTLVDGRSREALCAADVALLACGTASMEALLHKRPMVAAYRVSFLSYLLFKKTGLLRVDQYAMPNFLTRTPMVPEFIQEGVRPGAMGEALLALLNDAGERRQMREEFDRVHRLLRRDASRRAAEAVLELLGRWQQGAVPDPVAGRSRQP